VSQDDAPAANEINPSSFFNVFLDDDDDDDDDDKWCNRGDRKYSTVLLSFVPFLDNIIDL